MYPRTFFTFFSSGLLLLLLLSFSGCNNDSAPSTTEAITAPSPLLNFTFEPGLRFGPIMADSSSLEQVKALYGDSARMERLYLYESEEGEGLVLFPDNPLRRAELFYDQDNDPKRPMFIRIYGLQEEGIAPKTEWTTTDGISIGSGIEEVSRKNGRPFLISGFGWDYGGRVMNWNGGKYDSRFSPGFTIQSAEEEEENDAYLSLLGDGQALSSDNDTLRKFRPIVINLTTDLGRTPPQLTGGWRSLTNSDYTIDVTEDQISYFMNDRLSMSSQLQLDQGCKNAACGTEGMGDSNSYCWIETGQYGVQCHVLVRMHGDTLSYYTVGSLDAPESFLRIK